MGGHLHIHFHEKKPSIQEDLNTFLQFEEFSKEQVVDVLHKMDSYLSYFFESFSKIFKDAIKAIEKQEIHKSITLLQQGLEEITFHHISLNEVYESSYIEYFDATKCFPLSEVVLHSIISNFTISYNKECIEILS